MNKWFTKFASKASEVTGSSWAFLAAASIILLWVVSGPIFGFSDTWQLVINTGTTIITFLMVFLIQNTQNRDAKALHLKLDEMIRVIGPAQDALIDVENATDEQLKEMGKSYQRLATQRGGAGEEEPQPASALANRDREAAGREEQSERTPSHDGRKPTS